MPGSFSSTPPGTTKRDLAVTIRPDRLTVSLSWAGRVLDGPLHKSVRASDACWALESTGSSSSSSGGSSSGRSGSTSGGGAAAFGMLTAPERWPGCGPDQPAPINAVKQQQSTSQSATAVVKPQQRAGQSAAAAVKRAEPQPPPGCVDLMIVLPKAEGGKFWKALFEGGEEKSHWEVRGQWQGQKLPGGNE